MWARSSSGHSGMTAMRRRPVAVYRVIDESALLAESPSEVPDALPPRSGGYLGLSAASDGEVSVDGWLPETIASHCNLAPRRARVFLGMCALALVAAGALTVAPLGMHRKVTVEGHMSAAFQPLRNRAQNIESGGSHRHSPVRAERHGGSRTRVRVSGGSQAVVGYLRRASTDAPSIANVSRVAPPRSASPAQEFGFER